MKKFLLTLIALFSILFLKVELAQAQVDSLHYMPPMCSFTNDSNNVKDHQMVLTTSETTPFDVTIRNNDGTFTRTVSLSASNPQKISLNYSAYLSSTDNTPANKIGAQGIIGTTDLNKVLDIEGLIVSGSKKFFVNIQNVSGAQGDLLTSKGTTGLGTDFYSGHMYSVKSSYDSHNGHFIGVMATENNTNITFSNSRILFAGQTSNSFTVSLNKGQSYVIGVSYDQIQSQLGQNGDLNVVNGTHITSNKPIAVSSGSMCASGATGGGRDVGFDQLVPTDVVGDEYILIKGEGVDGGAQHNERALVVATEDNTKIYLKGSSTATKTLDKGEYYFTDYTDFGTNKNLYIKSDKNIFCYQTLSGANKKQTAGFCFIPPLKCTADKEVTVAFADYLSTLNVSPVLKLVTQEGSTVIINGDIIPRGATTGLNKSVAGNIYWETYDIPESELINHLDSNGDYNFEIVSTGALNAMLAVQSGNVGGGGFFSGFGDVPQVDKGPYLTDQGLCGGNVILTATGFTSYNWYKDEVLVSANDDATYQPTEPGRYKVTGISPCGGSTTESYPSSEIRILPCLSVSPQSFEVIEGTTALVRVQLSHIWPADDNVDVTFDYKTNAETGVGIASSGHDYQPISGSKTIPSGQFYVEIPVEITQDLLNEDDEKFTFTISNVKEAVESITTGTITIKDDNDPMPTITVSDQTVNEDAGTVSLTVSLNTVSGKTITADYSISDNTTTQISDYTASNYSGSLSFVPGDLSKTISINIVDDAIYEPGTDEYFTLLLSNLVNTTEGDVSADISITDNETPPEISISDNSGEEGTDIVFQAILSHAADEDITFYYKIKLVKGKEKEKGKKYAQEKDFTNDYPSFSYGTIIISAGQTSFDFPAFATEDDNANEGAEIFTVNFSAATNATFGNTFATGTILDNEGNTTLSIAGASATEGNTINFTISASPVNDSDISFNYTTTNGTATSPDDFTGSTGTLITLPANSSSMTLSIATDQDTEEEGNETFTVEIGNTPKNVDLAANPETATGTIIDDDDTPIAKDDSYSVNEDASLSANVMGNDLGKGDNPAVSSNTSPAHGSIVINSDGSFIYTPTANYNGSDSFEYTIEDDDGDTSSATVTITVNSVNDLPIANDDSYTIDEDTQLSNDVTSNDEDLVDLAITVSLVNNVSNGTLTLNADGTFTYMPKPEYFGSDNFSYKITDGNGDAVTANVNITVTFFNDGAPVAVNDNTSTNEDTPVSIDILANDTDIDGTETIDRLSTLIQSGPSYGSLSQDLTTGEYTYTPDLNYTGSDSFKYTIKDNSGLESNEATVSITVTVDNDPPVAICQSGVIVYLDENGDYTLDPSEIDNGSNDDSDNGTVTLSVSPNTFDCNDKGSNLVTLTVTDADNSSTTCTTSISVVDNLSPTITAQNNISVSSGSGMCGAVVNYTGPVFTDNCDGDQSGTLVAGLSSGSTFPIGTTTVTYQYTDNAGNGPVQSSFIVTVTDDQKPVFGNTKNRNLSPNSSGCEYLVSGTSFDLTATDNCSISSLSHDYDGGGSSLDGKSFPLGTTDVTWTAEDIHNNKISKIVQVTVSTDLTVSISGPTGDENCEGEDAVFTASALGGDPAYLYQFFVNGTEETDGVSGSTFTTSTLSDGDKVTTRISDKYGCQVESSEIIMTIYQKPAPSGIFFTD